MQSCPHLGGVRLGGRPGHETNGLQSGRSFSKGFILALLNHKPLINLSHCGIAQAPEQLPYLPLTHASSSLHELNGTLGHCLMPSPDPHDDSKNHFYCLKAQFSIIYFAHLPRPPYGFFPLMDLG
jgi:hypothetical protein